MKRQALIEVENIRRPAGAAVGQSWFQAIYEHAAFGISLVSPDNIFLAVNPAYARMVGFSAAELVGRPIRAVIHPDEISDSKALNVRMDQGEISEFSTERRYLRGDGKDFIGRLKVSRVNDDNGRILFKLAMVEDISELKQREQALAESEARLLEAQQLANVGSWVLNMSSDETVKVSWSTQLCRIYGIGENEFPRDFETHLALVHPEDRDLVKSEWMAAWNGGGSYELSHRIVRPDGEVRHIHSRANITGDGTGGGGRRCVGASIDITERKMADDALRKSKRQLQQATDNVPALIAYVDKDRRYHFANRTYEEWYGITPEEIVGLTIPEVLSPDNAEKMEPYILRVLAGERQEYQVSLDTADGVRRDVKGTLVPNFAEDGTVLGFHVLAQDATKEKMAEEALKLAKEMAEEGSRSKSNFLANMSHELRTPLNAIIGFSEIISKEIMGPVGTEVYREYAQDIHDSGGFLLGIIGEILDYSKLESGKMELFDEPLDVPETVRSCLVLVRQMAENGGVTVECDTPETLPHLRADKLKFVQMLGNLLSNATNFTEAGGCIGVRARASHESGYMLQVYDSGIGLAPDDIPRALLPFEQVDNSLTRKFSGTGLGLPLCKSFVEMHGGTLEIESILGKGTTVTLRFPAERVIAA